MTKEEFLNLVYIAYSSTIRVKKESEKKIAYFSQLNINNEESEKAKRIYEVANHNINRLKEIILLPLYEKVQKLTNQELENYRMELIKEEKEALIISQKSLEDLMSEKDKLVLEQEENYMAFSSELEDGNKDIYVEKGKTIQSKILDIEKDIENHKEQLSKIQVKIHELQSKSLSDIREDLIVKLDLSKFKDREDIKYVSKDDVIKVLNNSGNVEHLLELLQEYRNEKNRKISYSITLPSTAVAHQLGYLNKSRPMINGVTLTVESFSDIYNLDSLLDSRLGHLNWYIKNINNEYRPSFKNIEYSLENLENIQSLDIQSFKTRIDSIIEKLPTLANKISYKLNSLTELDTFIGRNFKAKQIDEYKNIIIDSTYEFIFNLLGEELRKLSNCVKDINYEKVIDENKVFNSEYLANYSQKLSKDNCMEIVLQVNDNISFISELYQQLISDLSVVKKQTRENSNDLRVKLNIRQNKLEEINNKINVIVDSKLQSSDLEKLLDTYSASTLEENLAQVEFLQLINTVRCNAYSQNVDIKDLYEFSDNFVFPNEEEVEGTKKV